MTEEEDWGLLQALRDYRPPKKLHKIGQIAWAMYEQGGDALSEEAIDALRFELKGYHDIRELTDALCGLSAFMIYISEHENNQDAAEAIGKLIKEVGPRYNPLGERVFEALTNLGSKIKGTFDRFSDRDQTDDKRAPAHDEAPPDGTLPLKDIKPPARPPRWAKKK